MANHWNDQRPIARRHLRMRRGDDTVTPVYIEIYAPTETGDKEEYHCRYRITGLKRRPIEEKSVGVDAVQALHLCIQMVASSISAASQGVGVAFQWDEGSKFDNLELCEKEGRVRRKASVAQPDTQMDREIRAAFSTMYNDPDAAQRAFKRLRRRARRLGLIRQAMQCLDGQLTIVRARGDDRAELRLVRSIAEHQPSAENLVVVASELERRGRLQEAPTWLERALAVADEGTEIHEFITGKLESMRGKRRRRDRRRSGVRSDREQ